MEWLRALCCCSGQDEDDSRHLVNHHDDHESLLTGDVRRRGSVSHPYDDNSGSHSSNLVPKTREQAEEELLKKILERTQQRVIEVSNYEIFTGDVDVAERSSKYQIAVSKHDENKSLRLPASLLLADSGLDITSVMQRPGLIDDDLQVLVSWNKSCTNAVKVGLQIEKKEDIVVLMKGDE